MAIFVFALGLVLAICGGASMAASVDLLPTEMGMLYAMVGAVALCSACIVVSIGALITRLGTPREAGPKAVAQALATPVEPVAPVMVAPTEAEPTAPEAVERVEVVDEDVVNENRAGHLPTLDEVESAIAHPEPPPTLVGRYSAGGANYMIFSDGTIEAELEGGAYRFASMGDFKAYIAGRKD